MSDLERIVRPFQLRDVSKPRTLQPATGQRQAKVRVIAGRSGGGKVMHGHSSASTTLYNKKYPKETETAS